MMRRAASELTPWLAEKNLGLFSQADGLPRRQMLERFKANPRSVLFGTDSFWQGVDVPGDALQNVIITKLPFSRAGSAVAAGAARGDPRVGRQSVRGLPASRGGDQAQAGLRPTDPLAADHGIVVLLDPRVCTKPYGRLFIESLPDCEVVEEQADERAEC